MTPDLPLPVLVAILESVRYGSRAIARARFEVQWPTPSDRVEIIAAVRAQSPRAADVLAELHAETV